MIDARYQAVAVAARGIATRTNWNVEVGDGAFGGFVVSCQGQTIGLGARELYVNTAREAYLELTEFDQTIPVKKQGLTYYLREDLRRAGSRRIEIRRLPELGWCWEMDERVQPAVGTADAILNVLLDRVEVAGKRRR